MKNKQNSGVRTPSKMRKMRFGWYAALLTVLVIAAVGALNVVVDLAESRWALKLDASPNNITGFSDDTYAMLDALAEDVHVYLLFSKQDSSELKTQLDEIVAKYRARNSHVIIDSIDPVTQPNLVNKYKSATSNVDMQAGSLIITNADESRVRLVPRTEMYTYSQNQQTGQYSVSSFQGEAKLTQGINYVTSTTTPRVFFLTGHEEASAAYFASLTQMLASDNIEIHDLTLSPDMDLKPGDTLVIAVPQLDITGDEYKQLQAFLDDGGRMLFVQDAQIDLEKTPNFVKLLAYYGIEFMDGIVVEDQSQADRWLQTPNLVVPKLNVEHDITKDSGGARLIVPNGRALTRSEMPMSGWSLADLLTTSDKSYVKALSGDTDILTIGPDDIVGAQSLAVAALNYPDDSNYDKTTRIVVLGSPYLVVDSELFNSSHNPMFALSTFNWLIDNKETTYIRGKAIANTVLNIPNQMVLLVLSGIIVIVIPLVVFLWGIVVHLRRRRL